MTYDYLFIVTHLGAQLGPLHRTMQANSQISISEQQFVYSHPSDLHLLTGVTTARKKGARVITDILSHNHALRTPAFDNICKFLYYISDPSYAVSRLAQEENYPTESILRYYAFRLQRMALMARNTPNSIFLNWDMLDDHHAQELSDFLHLKTPLFFSIEGEDTRVQKSKGSIAKQAQKIYDKYCLRIQDAIHSLKTA